MRAVSITYRIVMQGKLHKMYEKTHMGSMPMERWASAVAVYSWMMVSSVRTSSIMYCTVTQLTKSMCSDSKWGAYLWTGGTWQQQWTAR